MRATRDGDCASDNVLREPSGAPTLLAAAVDGGASNGRRARDGDNSFTKAPGP